MPPNRLVGVGIITVGLRRLGAARIAHPKTKAEFMGAELLSPVRSPQLLEQVEIFLSKVYPLHGHYILIRLPENMAIFNVTVIKI